MVIGAIYRHPGHKYDTFCDKLCRTLDSLNTAKTKYLIVGDMNIDLLKFKLATDVTNYVNCLYSIGCNICIDKPTRVTPKSATCIDHIYSNITQDDLVSQILLSDVSDHYSTLTKISSFSKTTNNSDIFVRKSKLTENEWFRFNFELGNILCHKLSSGFDYNVNDQADIISQAYKTVVDKFMPLRKLSQKKQRHKSKPWMTAGLKISCATKNNLLAISKLSRDPEDYQKYKSYLNLFYKNEKESTQKLFQEQSSFVWT